MGISSIVGRVLPAVIGYAQGGPVAAAASFVAADKARDEAKKQRMAIADYNAEMKGKQQMDPYLQSYVGGTSVPTIRQAPTTQNAGFGSSFGTFLGDVGRPDLSQKSDDLTMKDLAGIQYESLRNRILPLADDVIVYPAHGAGSACGKNMMKETVDTLGNQKKINYALRSDMTKEQFIQEVTDGLSAPPDYFPLNVKMNKEGYDDINLIIDKGDNPIDVSEFEEVVNQSGALILDVRNQEDFSKGHIPRSIFIGLNGSFAPWVGTLVKDVKQPIILVVDKGKEKEAIKRLSRVGFDKTIGYLKGGFDAWKNSSRDYDTITSISANEFEKKINDDSFIIDVRRDSEHKSKKIVSAINTPLDNINNYLKKLPNNQNFYIHCERGYRSMIASSILKSRGIHNLIDIKGGFQSIIKTNISLT